MTNNPVYLQDVKSQTADDIGAAAILVRNALLQQGLETPMFANGLSNEEKYKKIRDLMTVMMKTLGLDLGDDSLMETPHRIAKMYVREIFSGLDYANFPRISMIENKMDSHEMVRVGDIALTSTCEHHFVTIDGFAQVAYIPGDRVIGLSKINRIVKFFAKRPQVQERLTRQIQVALQTLLETEDVAVCIEATHYCVKSRGVEDGSSSTRTSALGGQFNTDSQLRNEFFRS
jgi:GTP cyclohydrolase I